MDKLTRTNVILRWEESVGADFYVYCIDTIDNGVCDTTWVNTGTSRDIAVNDLSPFVTYYWFVAANNGGGVTYADAGTSLWVAFYSHSSAGILFVTRSRGWRLCNYQSNPQLGASIYASTYTYCVDTIDNDICDTSWVRDLPSTSVTLSGLENNETYYWSSHGDSWWRGHGRMEIGGAFTARNQTFADVPIDHSLWQYIEAFYTAGITGGCGFDPLIFCPTNNVTRAAMAVFLLRAKYGAGYAPPAATHTFADLPVAGKEWQEAWVDQFYLEGITTGCGTSPLRYCPENPVTRAAMAVFILRALEGASYTPPAASHFFADMPVAGKEWMEPWVDEVYRRGITTGCGTGPLIYCPETAVKRQAMAAFIVRAFNLPLP